MGNPAPIHTSICPLCGVGCGVDVEVAGNRVVTVRGTPGHAVSQGNLCALGHNLPPMVNAGDRAVHPLIRRGDGLTRTSWDEAGRHVAERITEIVDRRGPEAVAMYISASEYLEEYYVYNKLMKGCLGSNNLESSARLCWASGVVGITKSLGEDAPPCTFEDIEEADLCVISGYNPAVSKPVLFRRLLRARNERGLKLVVIDPRRTATAKAADLHLMLAPGSDVLLHHALGRELLVSGSIDEAAARERTVDFEAWASQVRKHPASEVAQRCGLDPTRIVELAEWIAHANAALFTWGQGLNQSRIGTRKVTTFLNLPFVTGHFGRPGAGPLAVTGQTGAMALREVGALPHLLPGFRLVSDPRARKDIARIWGMPDDRISARPGLTLPGILRAIDAGEIEALWVIHANPAATFPDTRWTEDVLGRTPFLVVQDCVHPTATSILADVVLPAASWPEKGGTTTHSARGMHLVEAAVPPPGEARPDQDIVIDIANRMGFGEHFDFADQEAIYDEFRSCTAGRPNDLTGLDRARMKREPGLQWPVPGPDHPGTKRRFQDGQLPRSGLRLHIDDHSEPAEPPDDEYPLWLISGAAAGQYHSGNRSSQAPRLAAMARPWLEMHPDDAEQAGVSDGQTVELQTRRGRLDTTLHVSEDIRPGAIFLPYHFGANLLTHRAFDEFADQPEYKACAARVVGMDGSGSEHGGDRRGRSSGTVGLHG